MNRQDAQAEQTKCFSHAEKAYQRALRLESKGFYHAADASWQSMLYWKAQATRENVMYALANHT